MGSGKGMLVLYFRRIRDDFWEEHKHLRFGQRKNPKWRIRNNKMSLGNLERYVSGIKKKTRLN